MQSFGLPHIELIWLLLLVLVAAFAVLAKRIQVPYPIVLVIGGLGLSLLPGIPRVALNPEVIFSIFLPPLLFSASFHISWRDFRENLVSILMLAFGLVGFTLFGVAITTRWLLPGFNWQLGLVLGAVISPTDAIAATSIAKRLGLPRNIVDLLEAESLVNDGSGLLALKFTTAILVTGIVPSLLEGCAQLLYLITAGVLIGILVGAVTRLFQRGITDAPVEITLSLIAPYLTYLTAEAAHCSGVLATIACGVYLGRGSSRSYSLHARIESSAVWRTLDFVLNGFVFLQLGLQMPWILSDIRGVSVGTLILDGALFSLIVVLLRLLWVFPGAWVSVQIRRRLLGKPLPNLSNRMVFLVGWAGMRGVLALAAAMSLPEQLRDGTPFPQRSLIIFLAFCAIFATLVVQGLSMPAIIRSFGLAGASATEEETLLARRAMISGAIDALERMRRSALESEQSLDAVEGHYRREMSLLDASDFGPELLDENEEKSRRHLAHRLRAVERSVLRDLRQNDKFHDQVLRKLERELDLFEARLSEDQ